MPPLNGGKPTTAAGWSQLYRDRFDNFPAGKKRNAQLAKIIETAAVDGFSFVESELRFVSVTADTTEAEPDDLPF